MNLKEALDIIEETLDQVEGIPSSDIPDIDLYMDQVTTFMENKFRDSTRNPEEDKIMTKTMINNYAKNDLLPAPVKKKYSKDHMMLLILIYYYKGLLSISDIATLIRPLKEHFGQDDGTLELEQIYTELISGECKQADLVRRDIKDLMKDAEGSFTEAPAEAKDSLQLLSLISSLGFDIYLKKLVIGRLLDELEEKNTKNQKPSKK
ncbi:MAG: DUF1836 domain-containing protein [Lachnospiraceae bacterium]|nr:DUF1836 domain-containing protein [Lachnospiraceae bacterium]